MAIKSAVVTGGGSGIGFAVAQALHAAGMGVTIAGRREDVLAEASRTIAATPAEDGSSPEVRYSVSDVGNPADIRPLFDGHVAHFGGVEGLVTCAAAYDPVGFLDITADNWDATMDVALRGSVLSAVEAARRMKEQGGGRIVLFASINGFHSEPDSVHYSAAKAAIMSVAKSMAVDLAGTGVIANAVAPGWCYTPMTKEFIDATEPERMLRVNPLGRPGRPEELANVVRYLITQAPEFLYGTTIYVDGGQTVLAPMP